MGIDKQNIRFVIHKDIPSNLEAYYQEAGRAGRDDGFARCALIYRSGDLSKAKFLSSSDKLTSEELVKGLNNLSQNSSGTIDELHDISGLNKSDFLRLIKLLESEKLVVPQNNLININLKKLEFENLSLEREEKRKAFEQSRWEMMRTYAETKICRRKFILNYFGDESENSSCKMCDNDFDSELGVKDFSAESKYKIGMNVEHKEWGRGVVQSTSEKTITVVFDIGYKILDLQILEESNLLKDLL